MLHVLLLCIEGLDIPFEYLYNKDSRTFFFFKEASSSHPNNSYATVYFLVLIAGSQLLIHSQWTTADSNHILIRPKTGNK